MSWSHKGVKCRTVLLNLAISSVIHYESHVQIKSGTTLELTCKVTNAHSDITTDVVWTNEGRTLSAGGDIFITPKYTTTTKTFESALKVRHRFSFSNIRSSNVKPQIGDHTRSYA